MIKKFLVIGYLFLFLLNFNFISAEDNISDTVVPIINLEEESEILPIQTATVSLFIRNDTDVIYNGEINLPTDGMIVIEDYDGNLHEINNHSVLSLLYTLSTETDSSFSISDLQYYSSFDSFYLKCLTKDGEIPLCDYWQYTINGNAPSFGIDKTLASDGDSIGLYFGNPHRLTLNKNEIKEGESVLVTSEKYNYIENTWDVLNDISINVTIPNQQDPWNPTVVLETIVGIDGTITITLEEEGEYTFGIKEDYSFPSYQVVVTKVSNGGGGGSMPLTSFSISEAISFLSSNQNGNGSFGGEMYTDWVAIGLTKIEGGDAVVSVVKNYLEGLNFESSIITDYERHAMALMALGINPYNGTDINYIEKIVDSFDGIQIGEESLINDDIFGLIVLAHSGYTKNDEIISKVVDYLISKQRDDGSWFDIDITSASIIALDNFKSSEGVHDSISKAQFYLEGEQNLNGSFGNSFSTSWVIQALSISNSFSDEIDKAISYLGEQQQSDGGMDISNDMNSRIWATSYAIPAISRLSWNDILESYSKEENEPSSPTDELSNDEIIQKEKLIEIDLVEEIEIQDIKEETILLGLDKLKEKKFVSTINNKNIKNDNLQLEATIEPNSLVASALGSDQDNNLISLFLGLINQFNFLFFNLWFFLGSLI